MAANMADTYNVDPYYIITFVIDTVLYKDDLGVQMYVFEDHESNAAVSTPIGSLLHHVIPHEAPKSNVLSLS